MLLPIKRSAAAFNYFYRSTGRIFSYGFVHLSLENHFTGLVSRLESRPRRPTVSHVFRHWRLSSKNIDPLATKAWVIYGRFFFVNN